MRKNSGLFLVWRIFFFSWAWEHLVFKSFANFVSMDHVKDLANEESIMYYLEIFLRERGREKEGEREELKGRNKVC